ncbi:hypothetical protein [Paraburkholderia caffeinilytica]|uniref:hypothetical protein n=1 Tax=Paraburkholderia caffeinilytica TaxID=1761016 RepID=UPI0038BBB3D9
MQHANQRDLVAQGFKRQASVMETLRRVGITDSDGLQGNFGKNVIQSRLTIMLQIKSIKKATTRKLPTLSTRES